MRTETQEIYIAFDGTKFTDEEECRNYEINQINIDVELRGWTGDIKPLSHFLKNDNISNGISSMRFPCKEEKEKYRNFVNDNDENIGDIDWDADCLHYVYDTNFDIWINANERYFDLMKKAENFKEKWGIKI